MSTPPSLSTPDSTGEVIPFRGYPNLDELKDCFARSWALWWSAVRWAVALVGLACLALVVLRGHLPEAVQPKQLASVLGLGALGLAGALAWMRGSLLRSVRRLHADGAARLSELRGEFSDEGVRVRHGEHSLRTAWSEYRVLERGSRVFVLETAEEDVAEPYAPSMFERREDFERALALAASRLPTR